MDKKILVVTDGSKESEGAVREALKMAKSNGSHLYAMSVIEINPEFIQAAPHLLQKKEKETRELLEGISDTARKEKITCEIIIREGQEPYKLIVEEADKTKTDLIVIGRHGKTHLKKTLMGSVTAQVIGHSTQDVLIIPKDAHISWNNILVAVDGSKHSDAAVDTAIKYAQSYKSSLNAVSIVNVTDEFQAVAPAAVEKLIKQAKEILEGVKNKIEQAGLTVETFVREGDSYSTIVDLAKQLHINTIIIGSGRSGLKKILTGSVAERVIGYAECPVLVVYAD